MVFLYFIQQLFLIKSPHVIYCSTNKASYTNENKHLSIDLYQKFGLLIIDKLEVNIKSEKSVSESNEHDNHEKKSNFVPMSSSSTENIQKRFAKSYNSLFKLLCEFHSTFYEAKDTISALIPESEIILSELIKYLINSSEEIVKLLKDLLILMKEEELQNMFENEKSNLCLVSFLIHKNLTETIELMGD